MKRWKQIAAVLLLISITALLFSACKSDTANQDIWYPFDGDVTTLDPQCASTADELLVVQNTMEGLVRKNLQGEIIPGMAERWKISTDGLTYTFYLKKNVKWDLTDTQKRIYQTETDEQAEDENAATAQQPEFNPDITAHDFVFALRRACTPSTNAPYFNSISAIQNAIAAHSGEAEPSSIGVTALDDLTLQIVLSQPDAQFLETLTTAIAMPCCEEFFNYTKGRYGLEKQLTLFNGPFYLSSWSDSRIVLRKSEVYQGQDQPLPASLTLNAPEEASTILPNLLEGVYDAAIISGRDSKALTEKDGITLTSYERTVWGYLFNCEDSVMQNADIRQAVCYALEPITETADYFSTPTGIVPGSCNINGTAYRELAGEASLFPNDPQAAAEAWMKGLKELSPSTMNLTVLCTEEMEPYAKQSVQGLQKTLGNKINYINKNDTEAGLNLTIRIETVTKDVFFERVESGTYQIAFYPFEAADDSTLNFLSRFENGSLSGYQDSALDGLLAQAEETRVADQEAALLQQVETQLLRNAVVCPVLAESSFFAMAKNVTDIGFSTSGGKINFVYAKRSD